MSSLRRAARLALVVLALVALAAPAAAQTPRPLTVSYQSSTAVYLDGGRDAGLVPGARLRVVRNGETIAELEVDFVAEHSASCRVVLPRLEIRPGDRVVVLSLPEGETAEETAPVEPVRPEPETPEPEVYRATPRAADDGIRFRSSGSVSLTYLTATADGNRSRDETGGRISLRLSGIGGMPLQVRARARARHITRDGYGPSVAASQDSDRLYELSVAWAPEKGRFRVMAGRFGNGPYLGLGYLDGLLGEVRFTDTLYAGAFGGARPELGDLGFETGGSKYGGYLRWSKDDFASGGYGEIVVGGVSEQADGGEISRDYVTVESRFGRGADWWISQRAEIDVNRDWREEVTGKTSEISNAALAASFRISGGLRATLSYDQRRNYVTWESRPVLPEDVFNRYFREGGRLALEWRGSSGWSASFGGGVERADEVDDPTNSGFLSLFRAQAFGWPLMLGGDATFYAGGDAEGWVASLRGRWVFRGGHDVGLTLGGSEASLPDFPDLDSRLNQWIRVSGTVQLPARLFLFGEYEIQTGDDLEGDRAMIELGYRF
ncbi:MAG TPA: hypothetical protein VLA66_07640 [Thermoanaerobaculia bacterium]|nr:hypothetical protein [Thermoanaerobaculia bacterium]